MDNALGMTVLHGSAHLAEDVQTLAGAELLVLAAVDLAHSPLADAGLHLVGADGFSQYPGGTSFLIIGLPVLLSLLRERSRA